MPGSSLHTDKDRAEMLASIGAAEASSLFDDIPAGVRIKNDVPLPSPLSELELKKEMETLASKNSCAQKLVSFLGAGIYDHFIPSVVRHVASRAEFYTSYTPYQAEASQGMLQAIFEYQSLVCSLMGMDASNASMYDGASALAEAALLACHATGRSEVVVPGATSPMYRDVLKTYAEAAGLRIVEIPFSSDGMTDIKQLVSSSSERTAAVIVSQPNFFGCFEDVSGLANDIHAKGALFIVNADPISLGVISPPGEYGADIATAEGQALGNPMSFGGPLLGIFSVKEKLLRFMPGRIVGETVDSKGKRGFVLTLQAREQHIRREKALSNICSNQALCALSAAVYLASMGKHGLKAVASLCLQKAAYLKSEIARTGRASVAFSSKTFKEFVIKTDIPPAMLNGILLEKGIVGGLDLGKFYPKLKGHMLVCVTELVSKEDMGRFAGALK